LNEEVQAFGVKPIEPVFFFEIDEKLTDSGHSFYWKLKDCAEDINTLFNTQSQIYETKHGFHLVVRAKTWDQVTEMRVYTEDYMLPFLTQEINYFNDCQEHAVLRVTAKKTTDTGRIVSQKPKIIWRSLEDNTDYRTEKNYQMMHYCTSD